MPILGSLGAATVKGVGFTAVPAELPGIPTIGTATVVNGTTISVSFTAPTFDGNTSILSYTAIAYSYPGGIASGITGTVYNSLSGSVTVTSLTKGLAYTFKVYATNSIGASGLSGMSNNAIPANVPNAPIIGTATAVSKNSISIEFIAPTDNGGSNIISYTAVSSPSGISNTITQAGSGAIVVTGLYPATAYTFIVYATNTVGKSVNSVASNTVSTLNSYTISASPTSIDESSSKTVTFTIDTIGIANGTSMYWSNTGNSSAADFIDAVNSGSIIISATGSPPVGSATVTRTTVTDFFTEGIETIILNLQYPSGTTMATASTVNIGDTSLSYGLVSISPTTASQNIPKTTLQVIATGSYAVNMINSSVGTVSHQVISNSSTFDSIQLTPTSNIFTAVDQTRTINWIAYTTAIDYPNSSYSINFNALLDTSDGTYPTHAVTLNRIQYTEDITISPTSGFTNTSFTYTIKGAPGTTFFVWNSQDGFGSGTTYTLSGSQGDASFGTSTQLQQIWSTPGTYTVYVRWNATNHGDPNGGYSAGWATHTQVSVTVTYAPITFIYNPSSSLSGQVSSPFTGSLTTSTGTASITATGGQGGPFSYAITSGSQPSGVSFNSSGIYGGTPTTSGTYSWTITATGAGGLSNTATSTATISVAPRMDSGYVSPNTVSAGYDTQVIWTSTETSSVGLIANGVDQGAKGSNGSFTLQISTPGSYSGTLTPRARNSVNVGTAQSFSWTVVALPTATASVNTSNQWNDGAATVSYSSTGATSLQIYVNSVNGGAVPIPSGSIATGPWPLGSDIVYRLYVAATNSASTTVNSNTVQLVVFSLPVLTASWTASTASITIYWSATSSDSITASAFVTQPMALTGSQTFMGPFANGASVSLSMTATRTVLFLGSRSVTKSTTVTIPASGSGTASGNFA